MTKEDKDLLLKDLCGRLPYGVVCKFFYTENKKSDYGVSFLEAEVSFKNIEWFLSHRDDFVDMKPYLRPMSSMTKEEKYIYRHMLGATLNSEGESIMFVYVEDFPRVMDWLNSHHFDYRGLIEKGLALEAPEGMYKNN